MVFASADHRLFRQKRITIKDIEHEGWALSKVNLLPQYPLLRLFQDNGLPPPRVVVQTRSLRLRLHIWSTTDLLGYTSKQVVRLAAPRFRLREIQIKELAWRRPVGVIYRKDAYLPPAALRLIKILKAMAQDIATES